MAISKIQKDSFLSSNGFTILFPVVVLLLGLFLLIFVAPQTYSQITNKLNAAKEQKENYENLQKKLSVLQSTSPTMLEGTSKAVIVMPEKNPVLPFISQMKNLAIEKEITINDFKSNTIGDLSEVKKLDFEVSLEGASANEINAYLSEFTKRAPLVTLDEIAISEFNTNSTAKVKISVYWSALPTTLPALTDPLPPFSSDEIKTFDKFSAYQIPEFTTLPSSNPAPRENPFN
jgi:hypothetical protein